MTISLQKAQEWVDQKTRTHEKAFDAQTFQDECVAICGPGCTNFKYCDCTSVFHKAAQHLWSHHNTVEKFVPTKESAVRLLSLFVVYESDGWSVHANVANGSVLVYKNISLEEAGAVLEGFYRTETLTEETIPGNYARVPIEQK